MYPHSFEYFKAKSVSEALRLLKENDDSRILAGGQSLIPMLKSRLYQPECLVDIGFIPELREIRLEKNGDLHIGAMVTHSEVIENALIRKNAPLLSSTAENIGDMQIRNRGTIGGSVCEADPSADYPPSLMVLDARVVLKSEDSSREVGIDEFIVGPYENSAEEGEILVEVIVPSNTSRYKVEKYARRKADFAIALVAVSMKGASDGRTGDTKISIGALQEKPVRLTDLEHEISNKELSSIDLRELIHAAVEPLEPIEDLLGGSDYRRYVIEKMVARIIRELATKEAK